VKQQYLVADTRVVDETIVNKSRFICYLAPCQSSEAAKAHLEEVRQLHPNASHHCYAFISSFPEDSQSYGFSDDGEPTGTAGRPMLAVLQGSGIGEISAIVVRYFGGTKLGTGGLQRAYGGSVREALTKMNTRVKVPMANRKVLCQYAQVNDILRLVEQFEGKVLSQAFQTDVELCIAIPIVQVEHFADALTTLSAGQLALQELN